VFVTAHEVEPEWHIRMQAAFQEFTDNAVSKTINFPNGATVEDIRRSYKLAWRLKCKGLTIYRDGSRDAQVMNVGSALAKKQEVETRADAEATVRQAMAPRPSDEAILFDEIPPGQSRVPGLSYLRPRSRPRITHGYTEQIKTGDGTLYVTINEDEYGLCEVFASIGNSGGNAAAQSEAIGRLISLAIRANIDPRQIVKQLKGISGANPIWYEGELIRSTPGAIGRALERYLDIREHRQTELPLEGVEAKRELTIRPAADPLTDEPSISFAHGVQVKELCPECRSPVIFEEGCLICRRCGYSKCG
jgi:ribonucleoside-diphosphate reductase alpha chain